MYAHSFEASLANSDRDFRVEILQHGAPLRVTPRSVYRDSGLMSGVSSYELDVVYVAVVSVVQTNIFPRGARAGAIQESSHDGGGGGEGVFLGHFLHDL